MKTEVIDIINNPEGGYAFNIWGLSPLSPFNTVIDALDWAAFCRFTHYRRNGGKARKIPSKHY